MPWLIMGAIVAAPVKKKSYFPVRQPHFAGRMLTGWPLVLLTNNFQLNVRVSQIPPS